jgi:hypothetical protein
MGDGSVDAQGDLMPVRFLPRAVCNLQDEWWRTVFLRQALTRVPLAAHELAYIGSLDGHEPIQHLLYLRTATERLRRRGDWNPTAVDWSKRGRWWMDHNERGTRG